jgi:hypothetical protein
MSSTFAFPGVITQDATPDHACSMTHHTDRMIACAWLNLKTQIPFEILNNHTSNRKRLTQSAVCSRSQSQGAREGPDSGSFFCTTCAQVGLLLCEPLQVVALKTKVYCLYSLTLCQKRGCPGSRSLLLLVQRFLFAARCFAAKSGYYVLQLCCFATNLGPSRVSLPVPFEPSITHKCSLCFHL